MDFLSRYLSLLEPVLPAHTKSGFENLYKPIDYLLRIGGKRIRPALVYMGYHLFKDDYARATAAAKSVEWFHNFTLMHDDIMDKASLRRGVQAVHKRWNTTQAILSGDAMLIQAYSFLDVYKKDIYIRLIPFFTQTALEVCKGQQWDIDFESATAVPLENYLEMIRLKTAISLGASLKIGAIVARASAENQGVLYDFGVDWGMAFQLQDDYLDLFGDSDRVGKKIAGDVVENKKTVLYISALQQADDSQRKTLTGWYAKRLRENSAKITAVRALFEALGVPGIVKAEINRYTDRALGKLKQLKAPDKPVKERLGSLVLGLLDRKY
ncbi:MAG: polyprenyl synthetase family protein [Flavobacteriales bacterium]